MFRKPLLTNPTEYTVLILAGTGRWNSFRFRSSMFRGGRLLRADAERNSQSQEKNESTNHPSFPENCSIPRIVYSQAVAFLRRERSVVSRQAEKKQPGRNRWHAVMPIL